MSSRPSAAGPQPGGPRPGLPRVDHASRRARARDYLADADVDALLVTAPANVRWLTGFSGSNGQLLLAAEPAGDVLVTDDRYAQRAAEEAAGLPLVLTRDPVGHAVESLGGGGSWRLGVEAGAVSWADARRWHGRLVEAGAELCPTEAMVEALRVVKDDAELARLAEACRITVDALSWLFDAVVAVGRTERELATALERRFVDLGADGVAFPSIVASGPNAAVAHHAPTDRALVAGDVLTVDAGATVDGYHADCTRTVALGHLDARLVEVYAAVEQAQALGRAAAVAGATGAEVDAACRDHLTAAGLGDRFVHGTGHGVGLDVHEAPAVARGSAATLAPATALTVEPGVYLPGIGGVRIEDTIVVTADGPPTILTTAPRELRVL
ncbi:M24 family metallopeptidase [Egicoccus halophilus]|uniref:X-Pro dipeptidase n=1 Tax=Egicoccus halophilus TaxID=1670830 RepID=A0A8J3EV51_9ACTN|nr:Xaa-Pro peptidase family protein [Egicoccus halophilus]GGI07385.1 X-Pro dipeptidase [Egicoccus halophilus]